MDNQSNQDYQDWLKALKNKVSVARVKAALAANKELIQFYFKLGKRINEQQAKAAWGDKLHHQLSQDRKAEFPVMKGFSTTTHKYCRQFYLFCQSEISQQTVDQLPWGRNVLIFTQPIMSQLKISIK
jgi:predicted nuclease of restriction endonuclease-like (RecB) superfamily